MHPDRPPPHPSSPFRWVWEDQEVSEFARALFADHRPPSFFDTSHVFVPADLTFNGSMVASAIAKLLSRAKYTT